MKGFFPGSLGQKRECTLYKGVHYTWQNTVISLNPPMYVYIIVRMVVY